MDSPPPHIFKPAPFPQREQVLRLGGPSIPCEQYFGVNKGVPILGRTQFLLLPYRHTYTLWASVHLTSLNALIASVPCVHPSNRFVIDTYAIPISCWQELFPSQKRTTHPPYNPDLRKEAYIQREHSVSCEYFGLVIPHL